MATQREKQAVFALRPPAAPGDTPLLVVLIPEAGIDHMRTGKSHDFDLTKVGVPIQLIIGRCRDRKHGIEMLQPYLAGARAIDATDIDVGLDLPQSRKPFDA